MASAVRTLSSARIARATTCAAHTTSATHTYHACASQCAATVTTHSATLTLPRTRTLTRILTLNPNPGQVERDEATWMFDGSTGFNVRTSLAELRQAVRATLHAHGLISLCLDRRPPLTLQLPPDWPAMAVELLGACPDMGFSKVTLTLTLTLALTLTLTQTLTLTLILTVTLTLP